LPTTLESGRIGLEAADSNWAIPFPPLLRTTVFYQLGGILTKLCEFETSLFRLFILPLKLLIN